MRYGLYSKFWGIAQDKHKNFGNEIVFDPQVRNIDIFHPKTYKIRCYEQYRFDKNLLGQVVYCYLIFMVMDVGTTNFLIRHIGDVWEGPLHYKNCLR